MKHLELLKAKLKMLAALPDYYDASVELLQTVSEIEKEHGASVSFQIDQLKKQEIDRWAEILNETTKFAIIDGVAYKISVTKMETIPQGEKVLYVQKY